MALLDSVSLLLEQQLGPVKKRYDYDLVDLINHRYSMYLFSLFGLAIGTSDYIEENIHCWAPAEFPEQWVDYANRLCWISNTYYVPFDETIPDKDETKEHHIAYYQWVPLIIFLQAALFTLPNLVWKSFNRHSGFQLNKIIKTIDCIDYNNIAADTQNKVIYRIVDTLDEGLLYQKPYKTDFFTRLLNKISANIYIICGKRYGNYLTSLYLLVKLLYICNSAGQLIMLNTFLGSGYYLYGYQMARDLMNGRNVTSKRFPKVTLCDFKIRSLGDRIRDYTVQCVLPLNLYHEATYVIVWFWLVFMTFVNVLSLGWWMWTLFSLSRLQFVTKYLKIMQKSSNKCAKHGLPPRAFCEQYLQQDGVFMLRLISKNTNDIVVGEIIQAMWEKYNKHYPDDQKPYPDDKKPYPDDMKPYPDDMIPLSDPYITCYTPADREQHVNRAKVKSAANGTTFLLPPNTRRDKRQVVQ